MTGTETGPSADLLAAVLGRPLREFSRASAEDHHRWSYFHHALTGVPAPLPLCCAALPAVPEPVLIAAAREVMAQYGRLSAEGLATRRGSILVRAASAARAATSPAPTSLRRRAVPDDLAAARLRQPYAGFFAVEEADISWRRFDGGMSDPVTRAAFLSGDAVTVLPYDPARDRVLLVEQFRAGPWARGDGQCWQLEAIAGRVDPGETPEEAARREAAEEAGLALRGLSLIAHYYPSPGALSEYLYSYLALCELPDGIDGIFGVAHEAEDIRTHLVSFDRLMELVSTAEIENAPLILTALWLQRERARLRGQWEAGKR